MQNSEESLWTCVRQEGRHLSDIIFRNWIINVSNQNYIHYRLFWCWHYFFILKINKVTIIWKTCVLFVPPGITCLMATDSGLCNTYSRYHHMKFLVPHQNYSLTGSQFIDGGYVFQMAFYVITYLQILSYIKSDFSLY